MVQLKSLQVQLETDQELLAKNIDLLDNTPKTINQKKLWMKWFHLTRPVHLL